MPDDPSTWRARKATTHTGEAVTLSTDSDPADTPELPEPVRRMERAAKLRSIKSRIGQANSVMALKMALWDLVEVLEGE